MSRSFRVITPPTVEPITLSEIKEYMRIDYIDDDNVLLNLMSEARKYIEDITDRAFATQTIQMIETLEHPVGGTLYGPVDNPINWYQFDEQLGANPFGATAWYFDMPMAPLQSVSLVETQQTKFTAWVTFPSTNSSGNPTYVLDTNKESGRVYMVTPPAVLSWRFTYVAGHDSVDYPLPLSLKNCLKQLVAHWYENRAGDDPPQALLSKILGFKLMWA